MITPEFRSLGEIQVQPDGQNLVPVAVHPVTELGIVHDEDGNSLHQVTFDRTVRVEERFQYESTWYRQYAYVPQSETIVTDNSLTARYMLVGDVVVERKAHGSALIDGMVELSEELEEALNDSDIDARTIAIKAALGHIQRSVIENYRPIVDKQGRFTVNPNPVLVGKTN